MPALPRLFFATAAIFALIGVVSDIHMSAMASAGLAVLTMPVFLVTILRNRTG